MIVIVVVIILIIIKTYLITIINNKYCKVIYKNTKNYQEKDN